MKVRQVHPRTLQMQRNLWFDPVLMLTPTEGAFATTSLGLLAQLFSHLRIKHAGSATALTGTNGIGDVVGRIGLESISKPAFLVGNALDPVGGGGNVVIDDGKRLLGLADLASGHAQAFKCLW